MNNQQLNNQQIPSAFPQPQFQSQHQIVSLPGASQLLKETFKIYRSRFWVFVGIMIIPFLFSLPFFGLAAILRFLEVPWLWLILVISGVLVLTVVSLWASVSLLHAVKEREEKIGIKESFAKGWHKILSYWWVSILVGLITTGGFLLFIIPGIIFSIWFSLALYVLVSEELKGMNALFRSKQLIKGYWREVFWRFLAVGIIVAVIIGPITIVAGKFNIPFVTQIIGALMAPFTMTFGFLIYEGLKELKREVVFEPPKRKTKIGFILIGVIGILLIPAILFSIVWVSLRGARERVKDVSVMADMSMIRATAEFYYTENNDSYLGFSCSYPQEAANACDYISEQLGEKPAIHASKDAYCAYVRLGSSEYYCVDSILTAGKTNIYPGGAGYCNGITFVCP